MVQAGRRSSVGTHCGGAESSWVIFGVNPVREKLRAAPQEVHELLLVGGKRSGAYRVAQEAESAGISVRYVALEELDRLTRGGNHQGVAARVRPYQYVPLEALLGERAARLLFLDQVTDPNNLGAIIRSGEAFGVRGIVIPCDRAAGISPAVVRTAAGALEYVKVCRVVNLGRALEAARQEGYWVVGLDANAGSLLTDLPQLERVALVVGGEARGLRPGTKGRCDFLARIDTVGRVGSLNAGMAAVAGLFWLRVMEGRRAPR